MYAQQTCFVFTSGSHAEGAAILEQGFPVLDLPVSRRRRRQRERGGVPRLRQLDGIGERIGAFSFWCCCFLGVHVYSILWPTLQDRLCLYVSFWRKHRPR